MHLFLDFEDIVLVLAGSRLRLWLILKCFVSRQSKCRIITRMLNLNIKSDRDAIPYKIFRIQSWSLDDQRRCKVILCAMNQLIGTDGGDEVTLSLGLLLTTFSAHQIADWQICGDWNTTLHYGKITDRTGGNRQSSHHLCRFKYPAGDFWVDLNIMIVAGYDIIIIGMLVFPSFHSG